MALKFPKASSPEEFWKNIYEGKNCIENFSDSELLAAGVSEEQLNSSDYVKVKGGVMDSPHEFDAGLFNYSEPEARVMEPQMRIFHEMVWKALENAGYNPRHVPGSVGVYAGAAQNLYWQYVNTVREDDAISSQFMLDNLVNTNNLTTRVSYNFGFEGPSVFMYTACSTSLVSVHMACRALLGGECDMAVAGGSSILCDSAMGYTYQEGMILSPDGQCRAFDQNAKGTIPGEGVGVIVLKPLHAAISDGDNILGVVRSSAINNDGKRKVGFSAPSIYAQADVIKTAITIGEIAPGELSYIETHGTGTPLGDSVEVEGLKLAMSTMTGDNKCVLGSLKPNIGHLDSAAGIASIIKVILALKNKTLPPTINCDSPISALTDANGMFTILSEPTKWENDKFPLVAGVSSFGIGGTNAHVILEEAPAVIKASQPGSLETDVVLFSERSQNALEQSSKEIAEYISNESMEFESLVYTLKAGRFSFPFRRMLLAKGLNDIKKRLIEGSYRENSILGKKSGVAFVFSGIESKGTLLGKELYTHSFHFRASLNQCFDFFYKEFRIDLKRIFEQSTKGFADSRNSTLLNFCVVISLADTLKVYGIMPELVVGDSLGELAAAYMAELLSLKDLLSLLSYRLLCTTSTEKVLTLKILKGSQITMISSITGEPVDPNQLNSLNYWIKRPASSLLMDKVSQSLCAQKNFTFLELGRGGYLASLIKENVREDFDQEFLFPLNAQEEEMSEKTALNYTLGVLWLKGWDVQWQKIYAKSRVSRAVLPGVRFDRKDYSVNLDQINLTKKADSFLKNLKTSGVLNTIFWKPKNETGISAREKVEKGWLIFCDDFGFGEELAKKLGNKSSTSIIIKGGDTFKALSDNNFVIRHGALVDYMEIFSRLAEQSLMPSHILHCFSLKVPGKHTCNDFAEEQSRGFYSLLNIAKSLKMFEQSHKTVINVITQNLYRLCDEAHTFPEAATLMGPMKVIPQEYPFLVCRNIDIDTSEPWEAKREKTLMLIYDELLKTVEYPVIALRGKRKWIQDFQELNLPEIEGEICIRKKGTYIIFGGLGNVGFSFACLLASRYEANLIIAGKSKLEESNSAGSFIMDQFTQNRLDRLNKLKEYGTRIHYFSLDVVEAVEVSKFINEVKSSYQGYNGVIYAAGTVSGSGIRFIDSLKKNDCESQFMTKVYGVINVARAIEKDNPEFCLFVSSIASLLGGVEFTAYTGANAFLDSYILEQNFQHNRRWKVINWDGMNFRESMEQFELIASIKGLEQIFVSAGGELKDRLERWINRHELDEDDRIIMDDRGELRNRLSSEYKAPRGELEKRFVKIWQRFFGIKDIGIKDSFFELGGDSLKALTILSMIHKELNIKISIKDFHKNLTIMKLVKLTKGYNDKEYIPMKKAGEKQYYRLTPGQKRMYILWKLNKSSIAYNQTHVLQVKGTLQVERLIEAFSKLATRHDAFRTCLVELDGKPFMKVFPHLPLACKLIEVDEMSLELTIQGFVKPFNLLEAPLYRINILKVKDDCFVLVLDFHHMLVDGVSFKIIIRELMEFYSGDEPGGQQFQYKDYSEWLYEPAQQKRIRKEEEYWLEKLKGEIPLLDLKSNKTRPQNFSYTGDSISFYLETEKTLAIKKAAGKQGISLYVFLLSAYFVLLYKLTGQEKIIVGTPCAGRDILELENIVGFFVNTLAIEAKLDDSKTFLSLKNYVNDVVIEAFDNQLYPFDELVKKVDVNKTSNRNPLFDTMFVFQNMMNESESTVKIPGVEVSPHPYKKRTAQFDLTVIAEERNDRIFFEFEYFADLYNKETIILYKQYFMTVIDECLKDDRICLKDISLLASTTETKLLGSLCNNYSVTYENNSIQDLFENQVEKYPAKEALVYESQSLTYKELNDSANRLAHFLRQKGVASNTIVGLLLEPSAEMVIAILAILKAGGTYLPIDPLYPRKRIKQILTDSMVKYILLEDDELREELCEIEVYNLRKITLGEEKTANPANLTKKEDVAYIIYTSGTTGEPKGVLINHHNVIRLFYNDSPVYDFNEKDRWILCHSYCFDFSIWEIFGALLWGGTIVIIPNNVKKDTKALLSILHKEKITILNQTPSAFINLQAEILRSKDDFPIFLRYIIFGGENLKPCNLKAFKEAYPQTRIINMYGITEITVHGTFKEISEEEIEGNISNIGKPLPTLNIYLLDKHMKLVSPGIPGEIYVGGEGVSNGYLNKPQLTAERFIRNPYNKSEIIYKSGDLAFIDTKGDIIYIGRNDKQIQIRGFRVEIGEIERCLLKIVGIKNVFILAKKNKDGFCFLSAYIKTSKELNLEDIRSNLKKELPDYMIPALFYKIHRIPLTSNNKIDVMELEQSGELFESGVDFVKPSSDMENKITKIWEKILNKEKISIKDNFFEIGGDSLSAIQTITKMEEELEREIPPIVIFSHFTIESLSRYLEHDLSEPVQTNRQEKIDRGKLNRQKRLHLRKGNE